MIAVGQVRIERINIGSGDGSFGKQRECNSEIFRAELFDFGIGPGFLGAEIIRWKTQNYKARVFDNACKVSANPCTVS